MALYFFRYVDSRIFEDPDGVELTSLEDATREARIRAAEVWAEGIQRDQDRQHWRVDVLDDGNQVLASVPFGDAVDGEDP